MLRNVGRQFDVGPDTANPLDGRVRSNRSCATCPVRDIAPCAVLGDDEIADMERKTKSRAVEAGQVIFHEGGDVESVYTVLSGTARLCKMLADGRRQVVGFVSPGGCLGHSDEDVYSHTAEAVDAVVVCRIDQRAHERLRGRFPRLENHLLKSVGVDLARAREHMALLGFRSQLDRLAVFLLQLRDRFADEGPLLRLPMKRQDRRVPPSR